MVSQKRSNFIFVVVITAFSCIIRFDNHAIEVLLPKIQQFFTITDSESGIIKTTTQFANTFGLILMCLIGDRFRKSFLLKLSLIFQIAMLVVVLLTDSNQFLIFLIARSISSLAEGIFFVLGPVYIAEVYDGAALNTATTLSHYVIACSTVFSTSIGSILVASNVNWKFGLVASPFVLILFVGLILYFHPNISHHHTNAVSMRDSLIILSIPTYLMMVITHTSTYFMQGVELFWFPKVILTAWNQMPQVFLNLPYAVVMSIYSMSALTSIVVGGPVWIWFSKSCQSGSSCFAGRGFGEKAVVWTVIIEKCGTMPFQIAVIYFLNSSYPALVASLFFRGFLGAGLVGFVQFITLVVTPKKNHAAAIALSNLIPAIVTIPSAQLFGAVSDAIRGDSVEPSDQLHAYQTALILNSLIPLLGLISSIVSLRYFDRDLRKANQANLEDEKEHRSLLNSEKSCNDFSNVISRSRENSVLLSVE